MAYILQGNNYLILRSCSRKKCILVSLFIFTLLTSWIVLPALLLEAGGFMSYDLSQNSKVIKYGRHGFVYLLLTLTCCHQAQITDMLRFPHLKYEDNIYLTMPMCKWSVLKYLKAQWKATLTLLDRIGGAALKCLGKNWWFGVKPAFSSGMGTYLVMFQEPKYLLLICFFHWRSNSCLITLFDLVLMVLGSLWL